MKGSSLTISMRIPVMTVAAQAPWRTLVLKARSSRVVV
jgi:hypothetical protein